MKTQSDLFEAVLAGDLDLVVECVTAGSNPNQTAEDGYTPLCIAIRNGEIDVACYLISHTHVLVKKADTRLASRLVAAWVLLFIGRTQLFVDNMIANSLLNIIGAGLHLVMFYISLNYMLPSFDITVMSALNIHNYTVYSVLRTSLFSGCVASLVQYAVPYGLGQDLHTSKSGVSGTNLTSEGFRAFELILRYGGNIEPVALRLLASGLTFDDTNNSHEFAMLRGPAGLMWRWAAVHGHLKVVIALQELGIDVDIDSGIALGIACHNLDRNLCEHLVNSGAASNLQANGGDPPIVQCAIGARDVLQRKPQHEIDAIFIVKTLIAKNADIIQPGHRGRTALSICCTLSVLKGLAYYLLECAADPEIADEDGNTPLHHAAAIGALSLVQLLLAHGANPSHRDTKGKLPAHKAARDGTCVETLKILLPAAATTNTATQLDRDTMLFEAISYGSLEMLNYLLNELGANPEAEVVSGSCVLFMAMDKPRNAEEAVTIMLQKGKTGFQLLDRAKQHCIISWLDTDRIHSLIE
ncbi:MAG: hypothetical protein Q9168_004839 [Polycauliona sp. 1 TL-2023]